jgi:hypothetical protein
LVAPLLVTSGFASYTSSFLSYVVSLTDFLVQSMSTLCLLSQSIPSITPIPLESRMTRFAMKSTPLILMLSLGHTCLAGMSPTGVLTTIQYLSRGTDRLYFATYSAEMNECDAPKSNNMTVVLELTRNVPRTTSGAS